MNSTEGFIAKTISKLCKSGHLMRIIGTRKRGLIADYMNLGINPEDIKPKPKPMPTNDLFDEWYKLYPRKAGKGQARRAFNGALKKTSMKILMEKVQEFANACIGKEKQFIKHPTTWLNGECWEDEIIIERDPINRQDEINNFKCAILRGLGKFSYDMFVKQCGEQYPKQWFDVIKSEYKNWKTITQKDFEFAFNSIRKQLT